MSTSNLLSNIKAKAKDLKRHILLPDATDERAIQAARIIVDEGIAHISLVGDEGEIRAKAAHLGVGLEKIRIADPERSEKLSDFTHLYFNLRKAKGMQFEQAQQTGNEVRRRLATRRTFMRSWNVRHGKVPFAVHEFRAAVVPHRALSRWGRAFTCPSISSQTANHRDKPVLSP